MEQLQGIIDQMAEENGAVVLWDEPLRDAKIG